MKTAGHCVTFLLLCLGLLAFGCGGSGPRTVPVSGKIFKGDKPLTKGAEKMTVTIQLIPDKTKGNNSTIQPIGIYAEDGTYTVFTSERPGAPGKPGAPPGAYRVVLKVSVPADPQNEYSALRSLTDKSYEGPVSTPLAYEVVEKPAEGAYDLKLP